MTFIDDEGRIFGKFNLIDVVIGVLFIGAIPISYGAFVLFRTPDPSILSIEPTQVMAGESNTVQLTGTFLSPSLRIVIGDTPAETFLVASQESAEIRLPDLSAGTYDVILLDEEVEVARLVDAVTVESAPARGNLWAKLEGGDKPALVLLHHIDVVPADPSYWSVDPYAGLVKEGYLYGRGALDMKSLGICLLYTSDAADE